MSSKRRKPSFPQQHVGLQYVDLQTQIQNMEAQSNSERDESGGHNKDIVNPLPLFQSTVDHSVFNGPPPPSTTIEMNSRLHQPPVQHHQVSSMRNIATRDTNSASSNAPAYYTSSSI